MTVEDFKQALEGKSGVVRFVDDKSNVTSLARFGEMVLAEGQINGQPLTDDDGEVTHVPAFTEREGREATTIFVAVSKIVEIR